MSIRKQRLLVFFSVIALVAGAFAILYVTTLKEAFERNSRDWTGITEKEGYYKYRDELRLKIEIDGQKFDVAGSTICFHQHGYNRGMYGRAWEWILVGDRTIYWRAQDGTRYALRFAEFCNGKHLNKMPKLEPGQTFTSTVPDPATFDVIRIQPDGASAEMFFGAQRQGLGSSRVVLRSLERTTTRLPYPQDGTEKVRGHPMPPSQCWKGLAFEITPFPPRGQRPKLDQEIDQVAVSLAVFLDQSNQASNYQLAAGAAASIFAPATGDVNVPQSGAELTLPAIDAGSGPALLRRGPDQFACQSGIGQITRDRTPLTITDGVGNSISLSDNRRILSKHHQAFFVLGEVSARISIQD